jgi:hypothetical protein
LELDEHLKRLMQDLGIAINDALSDSPEVTDAIETVREQGYDVFLVLEATIGVRRRGESTDDHPAEAGESDEEGDVDDESGVVDRVRLEVNDQDVKFLKSLKIKVDDLGYR